METPLDQLNAKVFNQQLHTKFQALLDDGKKVPLELEEVEEQDSPRTELFFVRFRGPGAPRLIQKAYRMEHAKLGEISLFITAIGANENGIEYEAVFHRLRKKTAIS